jgi:hypothetical protein
VPPGDPSYVLRRVWLTKEDEERLGRIAPAIETLDPHSGTDPLTGLGLDPDLMNTGSDKDDRVDPNTGQKPMPGGK